MKKVLCLTLMFITINLPLVLAWAEKESSIGPFKVTKKDLCPVCGMFVHKYPNWEGQIIFKDRTCFFFDGAKDMFKYYFDLKKYNPKKTIDDIAAIWVTDYYRVKLIDGYKAFYVTGSDVLGPMGHELIPHASEKAAKHFSADHGGKKILRFDEIDLNLIESLR